MLMVAIADICQYTFEGHSCDSSLGDIQLVERAILCVQSLRNDAHTFIANLISTADEFAQTSYLEEELLNQKSCLQSWTLAF